jgi:hypothetical protein
VSFLREAQMDQSFGPLATYRENFGFVPNVVRAQALLPRLIEANERLVSVTLIKENALSRKQKARMAFYVAASLQDMYSVTLHAGFLRFLGISRSEVAAFSMDFRGGGLPAADVALLEFCVKLSRDAQSIDYRVERLRS